MKYLFFVVAILISFSACEKYDDCVLPIVGVYEAHVVGVSGPFDLVISEYHGDRIKIDAPWLGNTWTVLNADIDGCYDDYKMDINIPVQILDEYRDIGGKGFYSNYTIQIDYTIYDGNDRYEYTIVGTKK
ncbi:MAG TPA: hypothetical protein ENK91_04715 [Bacteroidetes bacterium]|nr:hypothetical protein [Bacteroidota bacterium]